MDNNAKDTFAFDLENRLDDFFSDSLPSQNDSVGDAPDLPKGDLPLKELKSTILNIDWEITDDGLDALVQQVNNLAEHFADDTVSQKFLKMLGALGKYLRINKSKAHPDAIKRIMSVYSALEESVTNNELAPNDKETMLKEEIKQFKRLKSQIVKTTATSQTDQSKAPATVGAVIKAINELKSTLMTELGAIRKELKQLNK